MSVIEEKAQRIVADGFNLADADALLAQYQRSFAAAMAFNFCGRRKYAQVLERQLEVRAIVETHIQQPRCRAQLDVRRLGRAHRVCRVTGCSATSPGL